MLTGTDLFAGNAVTLPSSRDLLGVATDGLAA